MNRSRLICIAMLLIPLCNCETNGQDSGQVDPVQAMSATSRVFRAAVKNIRPSLVTIESFGGVTTVQGRIGGIRKQGEGNTTGVLISEDGHIVTSTFNFIQQPPVITVITSDGKRHFAKFLGRDDTRKICVLKIEKAKETFSVPKMLASEELKIGQWAVSVGVGYGDATPAISSGIISATNRVGGRAIQTDANISPANYGGPLIDIEGRMLGVCVPMNPQSQAIGAGVEWYDSGIGFAVPLANAQDLLKQLKQGKNIYPAFLGIRAMQNPNGEGVWIEDVIPKSPAKKSGLSRGDVIVALDGTAIDDMMELKKVLNRFVAHQEVEITYIADGKTKEKKVTAELTKTPRPKNAPEQLEPPKIR